MLWSAASSSFCLLLSGSVSCASSGKNTDLRPSISHVVFTAPLLDFCWRCPGACLATGASGRLFALTCCCAAAAGFSTNSKAAACQTLTYTPEIREITFVPFWGHFWEVKLPLHGTPLCAVLQMISPSRNLHRLLYTALDFPCCRSFRRCSRVRDHKHHYAIIGLPHRSCPCRDGGFMSRT